MNETPVQKLKAHLKELKQEQNSWVQHWCDVRDNIEPQRGRRLNGESSTETNKGDRADKRVNGTATKALGILANGMQSGLTSKARQWFLLGHQDPELNKLAEVRAWYDKVQEILESIFSRSNIYSSFLHVYKEMAAFGQGPMLIEAHPDKILHTKPYTVGTYYMSADKWGEIDCFYQVEYLTARQIIKEYGEENVPQDVIESYKSNHREKKFEVANAFLRHPEQFGVTVEERYSVASVHFLTHSDTDEKFLRVSGYYSFPIMVPRWDVIDNDVYGQSPTRDVIGDVKMLQAMDFDVFKAVKKSVEPPWRIPPELERRGLNTSPNALNVVSSMNENAIAPLFTQPINIQQLQIKIQAIEQNIKEGYFNSLFLALLTQDNPQMTAREVAERHEEKLLMLGPVLERIHYELLDPVLDRAYNIAWAAGLIPEPPEVLKGQPTQIEYVSILSQAQKAVGVNRIEQSLQFLANVATLYPEVRHALDPYKTYMTYNHMIGVRQDIFRDETEYEKSVKSEQQQVQQMQQAQMATDMASAAKTVGETDMANVQQLLAGNGLAF